ncbi:MAG TPA: sodium:proton antiporter, partial [Candidatus Limnocylindria bacterium]|nr:sodium:proton antiporter [Candidatus Limnocylindria bacterium]
TLIAVEALHGEGAVAPELFEVATWTILLSVFAHGLSARPLAAWYGSWIRSKEGVPELVAHPEPRTTRSVI